MTENSVRFTFDERECAQRLNLSPMTIARLRKSKKIGHYRVGRRILYGECHIQKFLEDFSQEPRT
jgi:excisionase family DNA binding protein